MVWQYVTLDIYWIKYWCQLHYFIYPKPLQSLNFLGYSCRKNPVRFQLLLVRGRTSKRNSYYQKDGVNLHLWFLWYIWQRSMEYEIIIHRTLKNPLLIISIVCLNAPSLVSILLTSMETKSSRSLISSLPSAWFLNTFTKIGNINQLVELLWQGRSQHLSSENG